MALPERDLLVDGSGGSDLGNAVLELAFGAEVVTPDRGQVAESRRQQAGTEDISVALANEVVIRDLSFPCQLVTEESGKRMRHVSIAVYTSGSLGDTKKNCSKGALLGKSVSNRDCNADGDEDVEPVDLWE